MDARYLLVVTADFSVVQRIRQAFSEYGFAVTAAYSHLDALYAVQHEAFSAVIADSEMTHRSTGECTADVLAKLQNRPPLLLLQLDDSGEEYLNGVGHNGHGSTDHVIRSLEEVAMQRKVFSALRLPMTASQPSLESSPLPNTSIFWRDEEIRTLFALSRSLTEVLDLSEVLTRVVEAARRLTNAEEGMILLPDGNSGQLYLRAKSGIDESGEFRVRTEDTIAGHVFMTGQPALIDPSGPVKVKTEYFVNSLLYVPIRHNGLSLGVLGVNNKQKHERFNERHKELLVNLASYAAIAIENARIHGQSIRRMHELKALVDASKAINASLSIEKTLPTICEQLIRVLNVGTASVYEWDADNDQLQRQAWGVQSAWRQADAPVIDLRTRPSVRSVVENNRALILRAHGSSEEQAVLKAEGVGAQLIIPVSITDQVIAVMFGYYVTPPADLPAASVIGRSQRAALEVLAGVTTNDEPTANVHQAMNAIRELLAVDWLEFCLKVDTVTLKLRVALGRGLWMGANRPVVDLRMLPDFMRSLVNGRILQQTPHQPQASGEQHLLQITRSRSLLCLPLMGRGQIKGVIMCGTVQSADVFSPREIDLAQALIGQAATALENAKLLNDLERSLFQLKDAQERLIQAERLSAVGELAATVAHQINNPLTTIMADAELLLADDAVDVDAREALNAIWRSSRRAAGVVRRLLAISRPNHPEQPVVPVDVVSTISEVYTLVRSHIEREGIRIQVHYPEFELPPVLAGAGELEDVWLNLILNAHDALVGRGDAEINISIHLDDHANLINVFVQDNGTGIESTLIPNIFEPFFTTKPQGEGTGLGLYICRQVVERVGGTITVESAPETGTCFFIRLPIIEEERS